VSLKRRIHVLQHVPFEGPAAIEKWIGDKEASLSVTKLYQAESLPSQNDFDWLIVMGGPMGTDDIEQYPWLMQERGFILETIETGKCVLGICLGAQLIAAALGAVVKKNEYREIGWFKVKHAPHITKTVLSDIWPESIEVFHWHGDTFELPEGSKLLASSEACVNQGFILDNRVVGLQFHLEVTPDSVATLVENCSHELDGSEYVQSIDNLVATELVFIEANKLLYSVLKKLESHSA
jgi:GMP synthase-like glutamine amidotransferase